MKGVPALLAAACVLLTGCGSGTNATDETAPPAADSAYTGMPHTYPRATAVNQTPPAKAVLPSPPSAPAPVVTALVTPPAIEPPPANPPSPADTPAPASSMETTPPSPSVSTMPPRPMDDSEAKQEVVVLQTSLGNIVIQLNDVAAPRTCGNFRKLVSSGFYNHTLFHRVIPHFMIQGGDPNSKGDDRRAYGLGDPGYTLPAEIKLKNVEGAVAMARLPDASNPQRESNGSQFYICVADCPSLDDKYTVFGKVIRGMDTAIKISNAPRDKNDDPNDRIEIQATLETKQQALAENPQ